MGIVEIKAKKMFGGPGSFVWIAEAFVEDEAGGDVYVTYQMYDGYELTVSKESMYRALTEDDDSDEDVEFLEEYESPVDAEKSAYAKVFAVLARTLDELE